MKASTIGRRAVTTAAKKRYSQGRIGSKSREPAASGPDALMEAKSESSLSAEVTKEDPPAKKDKAWNDMSHLSLKRFQDDDPTLTEGAKRNRKEYPFVALAELDPSGRALCKLCGQRIQPKHTLRMGLMLECHKGYRNLCTLHASPCFWEHPETIKLTSLDEIYIHPNVVEAKHKEMIAEQFSNMIRSQGIPLDEAPSKVVS